MTLSLYSRYASQKFESSDPPRTRAREGAPSCENARRVLARAGSQSGCRPPAWQMTDSVSGLTSAAVEHLARLADVEQTWVQPSSDQGDAALPSIESRKHKEFRVATPGLHAVTTRSPLPPLPVSRLPSRSPTPRPTAT